MGNGAGESDGNRETDLVFMCNAWFRRHGNHPALLNKHDNAVIELLSSYTPNCFLSYLEIQEMLGIGSKNLRRSFGQLEKLKLISFLKEGKKQKYIVHRPKGQQFTRIPRKVVQNNHLDIFDRAVYRLLKSYDPNPCYPGREGIHKHTGFSPERVLKSLIKLELLELIFRYRKNQREVEYCFYKEQIPTFSGRLIQFKSSPIQKEVKKAVLKKTTFLGEQSKDNHFPGRTLNAKPLSWANSELNSTFLGEQSKEILEAPLSQANRSTFLGELKPLSWANTIQLNYLIKLSSDFENSKNFQAPGLKTSGSFDLTNLMNNRRIK